MSLDPDRPIKIVVEVVSSEAVKRLEARDDDVKAEVKKLEKRLEGLSRTLYELMEVIRQQRSKR